MPPLTSAPNGIKDGVQIMAQHVLDRNYKLSRHVTDSLAQWNDQQPGALAKRQTLQEFADDPLGEKRKLQNIADLNNALKNEVFDNLISK